MSISLNFRADAGKIKTDEKAAIRFTDGARCRSLFLPAFQASDQPRVSRLCGNGLSFLVWT
jgi:hypothetical protein